jgi:hypothetical protein
MYGFSHTSNSTPEPRRYQQRSNNKQRRKFPPPYIRIRQMERFFAFVHGAERLPDDDEGRTHLRVMAHHLAQIGPGRIQPWVSKWMSTLPAAELDELIDQAGTGWFWGADELAHEIGLDDAIRTRLKITTIGAVDCDKVQRERRRKRKGKTAARARRAKAGAKPHAKSAAATQPWIKDGVSRATYYRRRATKNSGRETLETNSSAAILSSHLRSEIRDQSISHRPRPKGADSDRRSRPLPFSEAENQSHETSGRTSDGEGAHGAEPSTIVAKPLPAAARADDDHGRHDDDHVLGGWLERILGAPLDGPIGGRW